MKKILSTVLAGALISSVAFAEVTVSNNFRIRPNIYKLEMKKGDDANVTTFLGLSKDHAYAEAKDTLKIAGKTDYSGITAEITLNADNDSAFAIDNYYGWLNFGKLTFTGGVYDSRYTNRGNYTSTEQGILDEEFSKAMGMSTKNGLFDAKLDGSNKLRDILPFGDFGNVSQINGKNLLSFIVDYTFADIGGGDLLVKGGIVENPKLVSGMNAAGTAFVTNNMFDTTSTFTQEAGYVAEVAWNNPDLLKADVVFKRPTKDTWGVGLYVTPQMIPNAKNVVVGFTYGSANITDDDSLSVMAVDLRGTYNITDAATVALGAKWESLSSNMDGFDTQMAMQVAGEFSYVVNDLVTLALNGGYFMPDMDDDDFGDNSFYIAALRAKFTAGKNAAITTAIHYKGIVNPAEADGSPTGELTIPLVMRVKL